MAEMARWTSGAGSAPIDLSTLVATTFVDCEVLVFQLKDTGFHYLVNSNSKSLSVDEIIWILKTKFQSLKYQGLWSPAESKKVDT